MTDMDNFLNSPLPMSYVDSMPCDSTLLVELGRVNWAAARLHSTVRDAINTVNGEPSDRPFHKTLGQAISELETKAIKLNASELVEWVNTYARPANELRNSVIHAVTYTAQDGVQALMTTAKHGGKRLSNPGLREISRFLIEASTRFPC